MSNFFIYNLIAQYNTPPFYHETFENKLKGFPYLLFQQETYPQMFSPEFSSICEYNS